MTDNDTAVIDAENEVNADPATEATDTVDHAAVAEAAFKDFEDAATAALAEADTTTGTIADANLFKTLEAFRKLPGAKPKNRAKLLIAEKMKEVLGSGDASRIYEAVAWSTINTAVLAPTKKSEGPSRVPVSPNRAHADKMQVHYLALDILEDAPLPEGVTDEWVTEKQEGDSLDAAKNYLEWLNLDFDTENEEAVKEHKDAEPDVSAVVKAAVKLATSKVARKGPAKGAATGTVHTGPQRNVATHIINAFDQVQSGTFLTVTEIKNTPSEEYGTDAPSPGAINQRLRPPSGKPTTIPGIIVEQNEAGTWGARKA